MAEEPDRIRHDIEATRAELARDVDRLADKTSPARVARRRWTALKESVMGVSETAQHRAESTMDSVRGAAGSTGDTMQEKASVAGERVGDAAHRVSDTVREVPDDIARRTRGNPVAAGVIAFGVGLLAASLIPETELERRAARQLKEQAGELVEPLREPLAESARGVKDDLGDATRQAAEGVKQTTRDALHTTTDQARESAQNATSQDATSQTRAAAQGAGRL